MVYKKIERYIYNNTKTLPGYDISLLLLDDKDTCIIIYCLTLSPGFGTKALPIASGIGKAFVPNPGETSLNSTT